MRVGYGLLLAYVGASLCPTSDRDSVHDSTPAAAAARVAGPGSSGYILFSPLLSTVTYLIDTKGRVVHIWEGDFPPGASAYLLDNGLLLRPARDPALSFFSGGGQGGRIQEFTRAGDLVWDFVVASNQTMQHHDVAPLPNGNVLALVWERKSRQQAIWAGRRPELVSGAGLWPDGVLEIAPQPPTGGKIVWEWHVWDHLIQDQDPARPSYGTVSDHPELVDINADQAPPTLTAEALERLQALGYVQRGASPRDLQADYLHTNSIAYNPWLDQIALSVSRLNELWVIDHSTTTAEAAGHSGGRTGRGGDLVYRWGNPGTYGRGLAEHQRLFGQHDVRWIPAGLPGAGNLMVFDNGAGRPGEAYSSVLELTPPLAGGGSYTLLPGVAFGPAKPTWTYTARNRRSFFADFVSGAHRLPNGNTFICSGPSGRFFEVTPQGDTVWEYHNPFSGDAPNPAGDPPRSVFRATHLPPQHPALAGRTLRPLVPQPPLLDTKASHRKR
ncbi:MAG TPA: aryl-sulfate sulfotransferase [Vicinamibacteria bacterium]|nr:aryl-sulfate sulfotransferase [Vicinamibacteria bacterium]